MSLITTGLSTKVLVSVVATCAIAFGGTGVAAYAGALPDDLQQTASEIIGAPTPEKVAAPDADVVADEDATTDTDADTDVSGSDEDSDDSEADPIVDAKGPDAAGPAAYGLCNAYSHGGLPEHSTAYQSLFRAADSDTDAYCATVTKPGSKDEPADDAEVESDSGESEDPTVEADDSDSGSIEQTPAVEKADKADKAEKAEKAEKAAKAEKPEKVDKPAKVEKPGK